MQTPRFMRICTMVIALCDSTTRRRNRTWTKYKKFFLNFGTQITFDTFCAVRSSKLKLTYNCKQKSEFPNVWGEYNIAIPIYTVATCKGPNIGIKLLP